MKCIEIGVASMHYNITYSVKVPNIYYFLLLCSEMQAKSEPHFASSSCFRFRKACLTRRRWGVMIYGPSWLEVDAILEEYCTHTTHIRTTCRGFAITGCICVRLDHSVGCKVYFQILKIKTKDSTVVRKEMIKVLVLFVHALSKVQQNAL